MTSLINFLASAVCISIAVCMFIGLFIGLEGSKKFLAPLGGVVPSAEQLSVCDIEYLRAEPLIRIVVAAES